MTPPMTPREKAVFKQPCKHCQRMTTVDLTALASGSGDHAELEYYGYRAFNAGIGCCHLVANPGPNDTNPEPLVTAASALALLAENAALRARENELIAGHAAAVTALERKLAEAERLNDRAADLMRQCTDPERFVGASTLNVYANMRAWLSDLSKEAETDKP